LHFVLAPRAATASSGVIILLFSPLPVTQFYFLVFLTFFKFVNFIIIWVVDGSDKLINLASRQQIMAREYFFTQIIMMRHRHTRITCRLYLPSVG
jgi:hypothetical protein